MIYFGWVGSGRVGWGGAGWGGVCLWGGDGEVSDLLDSCLFVCIGEDRILYDITQ